MVYALYISRALIILACVDILILYVHIIYKGGDIIFIWCRYYIYLMQILHLFGAQFKII
jgi:hypothetical protein